MIRGLRHIQRLQAVRLAAVIVAVVLLGGCTGDEQPGGAGSASATPSSHESSTVPSGDNKDIKEPVGAREDLVKFACKKKGGAWSATGKITNRAEEEQTYLVEVTVHDRAKGTVYGSADKTVTVAAGETSKVAFDRIYSGAKKKLDCTPRVVRGS